MKTILKDLPENVKDFLLMPDGILKNIKYKEIKGSVYTSCNVLEEEGNIFFSYTEFVICKNKTYYKRIVKKQGLSFKDGKLNIWFGANLYNIPNIDLFLKHIKAEWVTSGLIEYLTKGSLCNILKGKITNPTDLLKHYIKYVRLNASPALLYKAIVKGLNRMNFLMFAYNAKNVDHMVQAYMKEYSWMGSVLHRDVIEQCQVLETKINYNWSLKRLNEEHIQWTKLIMQEELRSVEDEEVPNLEAIDVPKEFEVLNTKKRIFEEGMMMQHCIYTNYYPTILRNEYLAFHIKQKEEEATLGVYWGGDGLRFSQLYGRRNSSVSSSMRELCMNWLEENKEKYKKLGA